VEMVNMAHQFLSQLVIDVITDIVFAASRIILNGPI
jgi:hypothetical protein